MRELERLRLLESMFDPRTRELLLATGNLTGRSFLEVGAGAGSIARFMRTEVGTAGRVVAVDTNTRFLGELEGVEVVAGDVLSTQQLGEKYVATGAVTQGDIATHIRFADDPMCTAIHYATLRVLGRKRSRALTAGSP